MNATDAALAVLDVAKERARLVKGGAEVALSRRRLLRVVFTPDMSYDRYHAPLAGNEAFEYAYSVWSVAQCSEDIRAGHVAPEHRGWRGLHGGEPEALALLTGTEAPDALAEGKALAARFTQGGMGPATTGGWDRSLG